MFILQFCRECWCLEDAETGTGKNAGPVLVEHRKAICFFPPNFVSEKGIDSPRLRRIPTLSTDRRLVSQAKPQQFPYVF